MKITYYHIDVFADKPFEGNPAIVCILDEWLDDETLLKITKEFNQPITTFLIYKENNNAIRWFTNEKEMYPCGHGSLAAAYVIKNYLNKNNAVDNIAFKTIKDVIYVDLKDPLSVKLPASFVKEDKSPENIVEMVGSTPSVMLRSSDRYVAIFDDENDIYNARPNFDLIKKLDLTGLVISAASKEYDFISRTFAPHIGINEDYVTGSSHAVLAPYWSKVVNKQQLQARQVSARPGNLCCKVESDVVSISGDCYLFSKGEIDINLI